MKNLFIFLLFSLFTLQLSAQGCSDAGFCTMGAMRPNQNYKRKLDIRLNSMELTQYVAYTKFGDCIFSTMLDLNIGISPRTSLQVRLPPYTTVTGKMPVNQGFGDVSVSLTKALVIRDNYQILATVGGKIPTNSANQSSKDGGHNFPTYQQTSLGTADLVLGASLLSRGWLVAAGYQQPLNRIGNNFTRINWVTSPDSAEAKRYPVSKELWRGMDVMVRVEKDFRFSRFNFHIGLLNIYRITRDIITDVKINERVVANGSDGLATNLLAGVGYHFSAKSGLKLLTGVKLKERKLNPDGLSRDVVMTLGYEYRF
jgi:hypothetical protein